MHTHAVALVTGGGSGIGLATAARLARDGQRVFVLDRAPASAEALIRPQGGRGFEGDVASLATLRQTVDAIVREAGRLDHVVCAAGVSHDAALWSQEEVDFDHTIAVDLKGCWTALRAAAPVMRSAKRGSVVCVSSTLATRSRFGVSAYAAAKAGLEGLVRGAARDLGRAGIRVNAVAPGFIETPLVANVPAASRARLLEDTPLQRLGQPDDVAAAIAFLLSDEARFITGNVVRVDGGLLS